MTTTLPPFDGRDVDRSAVKFTGSGTGMSEGLRVKPMSMDIGDRAFFVIEVECAGVEHKQDKDGYLIREHKLHTEKMAPINDDVAERAILAYVREVEDAKVALDGQEPLFRDDTDKFQGRSGVHPERPADEISDEEQAALDAEELDETGTPGEVAEAALARVITPSFSNPPAVGD